jgi:hypothetical protein
VSLAAPDPPVIVVGRSAIDVTPAWP